jgi:murein L,D-transpeptidase YcbB/YkuD
MADEEKAYNVQIPRWYYDQLKSERDAMRRDLVRLIDAYDSMAGQLQSLTNKNAGLLEIVKEAPKLLKEGTLTNDFDRLREILDNYRDAEPDDPTKLDNPDG